MGDLGSIPGLGRSPAGGHGNPLQNSYVENPHRQRRLGDYSAWGHKESDITEQLSTVGGPQLPPQPLPEAPGAVTSGRVCFAYWYKTGKEVTLSSSAP